MFLNGSMYSIILFSEVNRLEVMKIISQFYFFFSDGYVKVFRVVVQRCEKVLVYFYFVLFGIWLFL